MPDSALTDMAAMVGEWTIVNSLYPDIVGRNTVEWMAGESFLLSRYVAPTPGTRTTWVIGSDDRDHRRLTIMQHGDNGERRIYQCSFDGPLWRVWRDAPGDSQRLTGNLDETGNTLRATWERSDSEVDPRTWEHEFDWVGTRVS